MRHRIFYLFSCISLVYFYDLRLLQCIRLFVKITDVTLWRLRVFRCRYENMRGAKCFTCKWMELFWTPFLSYLIIKTSNCQKWSAFFRLISWDDAIRENVPKKWAKTIRTSCMENRSFSFSNCMLESITPKLQFYISSHFYPGMAK